MEARQVGAQVPKENDPLLVPNRKCNLCNEMVPGNEFTFHYQTCSRAFTFVQDTVCKICKLHWGNPQDVLLHILERHADHVRNAMAGQDHQQLPGIEFCNASYKKIVKLICFNFAIFKNILDREKNRQIIFSISRIFLILFGL